MDTTTKAPSSSWELRLICNVRTGLLTLSLCALAAGWPSACVVTESGTRWEWNLAMGAGSDAATTLQVEGDTLAVTLEHAWVSVVSLEAIPCGGAAADRRAWSPLPRALAHGGTTPTRMAAPHVVDLLQPETAQWASSLSHPPPDRYCWVRLSIGPADRDAIGMPAGEDLTDVALRVRGRYAIAGAPADTELTVTSQQTQSIDIELVDAEGAPAPLVVSPDHRSVAVDVWLDAPRVLDGVDPTGAVAARGGLHAITNVLASARAMGCSTAPCRER